MTATETILFRTLHKSGSMFVHRYSGGLAERLGWIHFSKNNTPDNLDRAESSPESKVVATRGFDDMLEPSGRIQRVRNIVQLRDPRDILVSEFFSLGFIHGTRTFTSKAYQTRERIQSGALPIDDYVLAAVEESFSFGEGKGLARRMLTNLPILRAASTEDTKLLIVRYEDMVLDFPGWSARILSFLGMDHFAEDMRDTFVGEFNLPAIVKRGEQLRHKRVVFPGDHKVKLKSATIAQLDRLFQPVLSEFYADPDG